MELKNKQGDIVARIETISTVDLPHWHWQSRKIPSPTKYSVKVIPTNKIVSFYLKALFFKFINKFYFKK